jgi:hypothetical protein
LEERVCFCWRVVHRIHETLILNGIIGAAAGGAATLITHPFYAIKTRFGANDGRGSGFAIKYSGVADAFVKICGFYKGLTPNLIRAVPSSAITLAVYEGLSKVLNIKT